MWSSPISRSESDPPVDVAYRIIRILLRLWFALFFRKIRLLEEGFPAAGPVILVIDHPVGFLDALILVAAFERQLQCVVEQKSVQGPIRDLFARALGMIVYPPDEESRQAAVESCCRLLSQQCAVVLFAEPANTQGSESGHEYRTVFAIFRGRFCSAQVFEEGRNRSFCGGGLSLQLLYA